MLQDTPNTRPSAATTEIVSAWTATRRRDRSGVDREPLVTSFLTVLADQRGAMAQLSEAAAAFGAAFAGTGGNQNALVDDIDALESVLLDHVAGDMHDTARDVPNAVASIRTVHAAATLARRVAAAAFANTIGTASRKRSRMARHDIANAIGTVRNAILLLEDETKEPARDHFRAIAKRNSITSESLVRAHLSDRAALSGALGWEELQISALGTVGAAADANAPRVMVNVGAIETMVDAVRASMGRVASSTAGARPLTTTFESTGTASGVLTIHQPVADDQAPDDAVLESLRRLASAIGFRLEADSTYAALRVSVPFLPWDQRHDLAGGGESHHGDAAPR